MKNLASFLVFAMISVNAIAQPQFEPGVFSTAGSVGYSNTTEESSWDTIKRSSFTFSPSLHYFVSRGLEVSFGPTYHHSSSEITNASYSPPPNSSFTALGVSLGVRLYLPSETVAPFIGLLGNLYWYKYSTPSGSDPFSKPRKYYGAELGVDVLAAANFAIEPSLQYVRTEVSDYRDRAFSLLIGFKYFVF